MTDDLNKLTTVELGLLFPVIISEYNPDWVRLYNEEKHSILTNNKNCNIIRIEHVGSTSVRGLCAKPTIDIIIEISESTDCESLCKSLSKISYQLIPKPENPPPHIMLAKGYSKTGIMSQTYHIHLRYPGDWDELIFRDYLRINSEIARQYGDLKKVLSEKFKNDREGYTTGKSEFIKQIVHLARAGKPAK